MTRAVFVTLFLLVTPCLGYFPYRKKIPNGENVPHPCRDDYMWDGVGHTNPGGGGERNQFGLDFDEGGRMWSEELCRHDSDGDGKTNGEELGDPNCMWKEGMVPERTTEISHPGICTPYGKGICAGRAEDIDCDIKSFEESCDVIRNPEIQMMEYRFKEAQIPATETNYFCQVFDLPMDSTYHIVADQGIIDNADIVHHMILYGCPEEYKGSPSDNSPNPCSMSNEENNCNIVISLWSVGFRGTCFGEMMGYKIGANGYKKVKLEIHYNNPDLNLYTDNSGIKIYYQPIKAGVQDLATFSVGQTYLAIPPGEREVEFHGSCPGECTRFLITKPLHVVSTLNHMHYMGRKQRTEVLRNGKVVKVLADDWQYSYENPIMHKLDEPFEVLPGDEIATSCTFSSMSKNHWVFYGDGTSDEMCFAFITAYPADALPHTTWCSSHGALSTCELYGGIPKYGCDWRRFTNLSNPEMIEHHTRLEMSCHLDGMCRRECQDAVNKIREHPCMSKEMAPIVTQFLDSYHEGSKFLGKLHSCDGAHHKDKDDCQVDCSSCDNNHNHNHYPDGDNGEYHGNQATILSQMTAASLLMMSLVVIIL